MLEENVIPLEKILEELLQKFYYEHIKPSTQQLLELFSHASVDINSKLKDLRMYVSIKKLYAIPSPFTCLTATLSIYDEGYSKVIEYLLNKGAKVKIADLIILADPQCTKAGRNILARLLEAFDDDINKAMDGNANNTILHKLAHFRNFSPELLTFVLKRGINLNTKNKEGDTALHIALQKQNYKLAAILLAHGAAVDIENNTKNTAAAMIQEKYKQDGYIVEQASTLLKSDPEAEINEHNFLQAIELFEKTYCTKVEDVFSNENSSRKYLIYSFFADRKISAYMARDNINFNAQDYPDYHEAEKRVYAAASGKNTVVVKRLDNKYQPRGKEIFSIPYRSERNPTKEYNYAYEIFYSNGTSSGATNIHLRWIKESFPDLSKRFFKLIFPYDIYHFSGEIMGIANESNLACNERGFYYVISATGRDNHIFATLSLIDVKRQRAHCHIVINSWQNDVYFE